MIRLMMHSAGIFFETPPEMVRYDKCGTTRNLEAPILDLKKYIQVYGADDNPLADVGTAKTEQSHGRDTTVWLKPV